MNPLKVAAGDPEGIAVEILTGSQFLETEIGWIGAVETLIPVI